MDSKDKALRLINYRISMTNKNTSIATFHCTNGMIEMVHVLGFINMSEKHALDNLPRQATLPLC